MNSERSEIDWPLCQARLEKFWSHLPPPARLLSPWTQSRQFKELVFVREELIGSYKERKYLSLVPWIQSQGFQRIGLEGSTHSGNVVQLGLRLKAAGLEPVYQKQGRGGPPAGNFLLSRLLYGPAFGQVPAQEPDWIVPEGGSCPAALAGSLGIAGSLVERALRYRDWRTKILVDSGTGFSATALLLGLGYFALPCRVTVVSMTGQNQEQLIRLLQELKPEFERLMEAPAIWPEFEVLQPTVGPSFGSVPAASLAEVERLAQQEGVLVDPIYSAKLSLVYQERRAPDQKAFLFVSGGARELLAFQGPLRSYLENR